eukprot:4816754-Alexandrium_andersonii.AAC.1
MWSASGARPRARIWRAGVAQPPFPTSPAPAWRRSSGRAFTWACPSGTCACTSRWSASWTQA